MNTFKMDMTIYKEDQKSDISEEESNSFTDDFIKLVESHGLACGGSLGLAKEEGSND